MVVGNGIFRYMPCLWWNWDTSIFGFQLSLSLQSQLDFTGFVHRICLTFLSCSSFFSSTLLPRSAINFNPTLNLGFLPWKKVFRLGISTVSSPGINCGILDHRSELSPFVDPSPRLWCHDSSCTAAKWIFRSTFLEEDNASPLPLFCTTTTSPSKKSQQ